VIAGYDKTTDTFGCNNCGGQYMFGRATGQVRLNNAGEPCTHSYSGETAGRCLTEYTCKHCGDRYQIDSGD
jgi:DNA-directed RNA polymerase subunit RPC12/RpoP